MPFQKLNSFTKKVADLPDKPNGSLSAVQVKAQFDSSPEELRVSLNALIDALGLTTTDSGAKNIGVNSISGVTGANIQAVLEALASIKTDKTGNHGGTWQGLNPGDFSGGSQALALGNLANLTTTAKDNLVNAVNEVNGKVNAIKPDPYFTFSYWMAT